MATIQNDNDVLLQAASLRVLPVSSGDLAELRGIKISGTSQLVKSLAGGGYSPATVTLTAKLTFVTGTPAWSITSGQATLGVSGLVCTIAASSLISDSVTVRATLVAEGVTYTDDFTIARVSDGGFGDSLDIIFRRSELQPATPAPSAGTPPDWYTNVDALPAGAGYVWSSFGKRQAGAPAYTWQTPVKVEADEAGEAGSAGMSVAEVTIYRRATSAPGTPTGGSFAFGSNVLTPPSGWSSGIPAGTDPVYISKATVSIQGTTGTVAVAGWTSPVVAFQNGTDGESGNSVDIVFQRSATQPATPPGSAGTPSGWYTNVNSVPTGTGAIWSSVGKRASIESAYTWQTPVKIEGTDGSPGLSVAELSIYIRSASTPATPTGGSFNFGTRTLTPPTGWSATLPAGTAPAYVSMAVAAVNGTTGTDSILDWSAPVQIYQDSAPGRRGTVNLFGNITGSTWSDASANSLITSNTGSAERITGDVVTLANSSVPWAQTRRWTGTAWEVMTQTISGDMIIPRTLAAGQISGLGALALLSQVNLGSTQVTGNLSTGNITGLGALATQNTVNGATQVTNLGNLAYANQIAANQIGAGTLAAGVVYAGTVNASNVNGGTLTGVTVALGTGGLITAPGGNGRRFFVANDGYTYIDSLRMYGGIDSQNVASFRIAVGGAVVVATNTNSQGTALSANNSAAATSGSIGTRTHAFYAHQGAYGPFTGSHDALLAKGVAAEVGDIMVDVDCIARRGVSDAIFTALPAVGVNNPRAIGVLAERMGLYGSEPAALVAGTENVYRRDDPDEVTGSFNVMIEQFDELAATHDLLSVHSLGEGLISVCGLGGDIAAGDLIVCSDIPGKGQRQADDIVRNYTVAKAREAVVFDGPDDVRLVPCIYLCG